MRNKTNILSSLVLVMTALAVTACGRMPAGIPAETAASQDHQIATVHLSASATREALQAAMPGAQILSFDSSAGYAILSVPRQGGQAAGARLTTQGLQALAVGSVTLEPDLLLSVPSDPVVDGQGISIWAGGISVWAGSLTSWTGGTSFAGAANSGAVQAYSDALGLPRAQQLVPEQGAGVRVAVIDTGVDFYHPMFQGRIDAAAGWDYVNGDAMPQEVQWGAAGPKFGHGTAVTGIIVQIAPNARILPYRVLTPDGFGPVSRVIQAIDRAVANGAKIINLSLGSTEDSAALNTAIAGALARGVLVVNSSGNAGSEGMLYPSRNVGNAQFPSGSGLLAVGSVKLNLYKSSFTSFGANMSLTAPGEGVFTASPDNRVVRATGTSFAAPAVSGALALAVSAGVTSPATLVRDLRATTKANVDPTFKSKLGAGTLNIAAFLDTYR